MSTQTIASYMGASGLTQGLVMLLAFPKVHGFFGTKHTIYFGMAAFCLTCFAQVVLNRLAKLGFSGLVTLLCGGALATMSVQGLRFSKLTFDQWLVIRIFRPISERIFIYQRLFNSRSMMHHLVRKA